MADTSQTSRDEPDTARSGPDEPIAVAGRNCWRRPHADRVAFMIDAADYFAAFRAAVARAERSILILGWDIDSRLRLLRDGGPQWDQRRDGRPVELGNFLNQVVSARPDLEAHVLIWDFNMIFALEREFLPVFQLDWRTHRRLHFRLDGEHPVGASHHQKIVVVDDAVAFCGGIDLTTARWDTPEHAPDDIRRIKPSGKPYAPFHDAMMMVDGDAAASLGEIVRWRWRRATGREVSPPPRPQADPWPDHVCPDMTDTPVAIARTIPPTNGNRDGADDAREVEALFVDSIRAARRWLYFENQYFTSSRIGEGLARRLEEEDGPEVVMVMPRTCSGWLEETSMGVSRARLLRQLRHHDPYERLRVVYPHRDDLGEERINVHSKILVVDDRHLRIGSANLSNRSMGLDTECDLAVDTDGGPDSPAAVLRNRLLGEHLGADPSEVAAAIAGHGSLIRAIEALSGGPRDLHELRPDVPEALQAVIPETEVIDPERPVEAEVLAEELIHESGPRRTAGRLTAVVLALGVLIGLAMAWRWTPLEQWARVDVLLAGLETVRQAPLVLPLMLLTYVVAGLSAFPITLLITVTAIAFGPWEGFVYALVGSQISAYLTYGVGALLGRTWGRKLFSGRVNRVSRALARRGIVAVALVRLVPVAPFTVINFLAGATHVRFRDYALGTLLGMGPGIAGLVLLGDRLHEVIRDPDPINVAVLLGVALALVAGAVLLSRRLRRRVTAGADG